MKQKWSLWKFLREELESERGDLVFLLMILVPAAVAVAVAYAHYVLGHRIGDIVEYVSSTIRQTPESDQGKVKLDKEFLELKIVKPVQRGEDVTKP